MLQLLQYTKSINGLIFQHAAILLCVGTRQIKRFTCSSLCLCTQINKRHALTENLQMKPWMIEWLFIKLVNKSVCSCIRPPADGRRR